MLLLQTKLQPPPARVSQVLRPRLMRRIDQIGQHGLTLITAPAGYGKTTLLCQWLAQTALHSVWFTIDDGDNDPLRFWGYFVAGLQSLNPEIGKQAMALLHEPQPLPVTDILNTLINDLAVQPHSTAIVLDDYHLIKHHEIHTSLEYLLDHLPAQLRIIIATRSDPLLPLARLRTRNQLVELRASNLSFEPDETFDFMNRIMGVKLSREEADAIALRTEGWVAGMQLAALAMQSHSNVQAFIAAFAGDHRYVLDYLGDEVLAGLPEEMQNFLMQTSILDRLNCDLCDAVTGMSRSQSILESLDRSNYFLISLDDSRYWFRYHQLFADFLRHKLQHLQPLSVPALHRRASLWLEQHGLINDAVQHAIAAKDFDAAARQIETVADVMIWQRSELSTLSNWLTALPEAEMQNHPVLMLYHAWSLYLTNQMAGVEKRIQQAEQALHRQSDQPDEPIAGMICALKSTLTGIHQQFPEAMHWSREALRILPETHVSWRCMAAINLGVSCAAIGSVDEAVTTLKLAMDLSQEIGSAFAVLSSFFHLATLEIAQLRLQDAERTCRQLLELSDAPHLRYFPVAGYIALLQGEIMLERRELEKAQAFLLHSAGQINPEGFPMALLRSYVALARLKIAQGDATGAADYFNKAEQLERSARLTKRAQPLSVYRARLLIKENRLELASEWVTENHLGLNDEFSHHREPYYFNLARLFIARAKHDGAMDSLKQADDLLGRMVERAERTGRRGSLVRALVLQSISLDAQGKAGDALAVLMRALALCEGERCISTFVDEGEPMLALLRRLAKANAGKASVLADQLIDHALPGETIDARLNAKHLPAELIEPLSDRELDVLRLLIAGLSNPEIASHLYVSVDTVKTHVRNIYGKLAVHNRAQAVVRAQALKLLR